MPGSPPRTTVNQIPYTPGSGADLVVDPNDADSSIRLWVLGDQFPRIVLDITNHAVKTGDGTAAPT